MLFNLQRWHRIQNKTDKKHRAVSERIGKICRLILKLFEFLEMCILKCFFFIISLLKWYFWRVKFAFGVLLSCFIITLVELVSLLHCYSYFWFKRSSGISLRSYFSSRYKRINCFYKFNDKVFISFF